MEMFRGRFVQHRHVGNSVANARNDFYTRGDVHNLLLVSFSMPPLVLGIRDLLDKVSYLAEKSPSHIQTLGRVLQDLIKLARM
jgi:hypothetical protein